MSKETDWDPDRVKENGEHLLYSYTSLGERGKGNKNNNHPPPLPHFVDLCFCDWGVESDSHTLTTCSFKNLQTGYENRMCALYICIQYVICYICIVPLFFLHSIKDPSRCCVLCLPLTHTYTSKTLTISSTLILNLVVNCCTMDYRFMLFHHRIHRKAVPNGAPKTSTPPL